MNEANSLIKEAHDKYQKSISVIAIKGKIEKIEAEQSSSSSSGRKRSKEGDEDYDEE